VLIYLFFFVILNTKAKNAKSFNSFLYHENSFVDFTRVVMYFCKKKNKEQKHTNTTRKKLKKSSFYAMLLLRMLLSF